MTIYLGIMEEYKICVEDYEISNIGNVRRKQKNGIYKMINGSIQNRGYRYFQLSRNGKRINYLIHHLVAKHFIGDRPDKYDIDHIDRDKLNNNVNNLRYVSHRDNMCNIDRFIEEIPKDDKDRMKKVQKLWCDNNRDIISQKKKEYYLKNKDKWDKPKNKIKVSCLKCGIEREIYEKSVYYNKTGNCNKCASLINLEKCKKDIKI